MGELQIQCLFEIQGELKANLDNLMALRLKRLKKVDYLLSMLKPQLCFSDRLFMMGRIICLFKTDGALYIAQVGLHLEAILLPQCLKPWDYRPYHQPSFTRLFFKCILSLLNHLCSQKENSRREIYS